MSWRFLIGKSLQVWDILSDTREKFQKSRIISETRQQPDTWVLIILSHSPKNRNIARTQNCSLHISHSSLFLDLCAAFSKRGAVKIFASIEYARRMDNNELNVLCVCRVAKFYLLHMESKQFSDSFFTLPIYINIELITSARTSLFGSRLHRNFC